MNIKLDNENINVEDNKSIIELFGDKLKGNNHIIACDINNEIKTLNYIPKENDNVSFVDVTSRDGRRTYIRGLLFIMSMAFNECYPEAFLSVNYQLTNAMYCEVDNLKVTREMIENVSKKMKEVCYNLHGFNQTVSDCFNFCHIFCLSGKQLVNHTVCRSKQFFKYRIDCHIFLSHIINGIIIHGQLHVCKSCIH